MTKPFNPVISLEEIDYLDDIYKHWSRPNKVLDKYDISGLAPNPELAKEFEEKLKDPDEYIPSDEDYKYKPLAERIEEGFYLEYDIIADIQWALFLVDQYNSHEAIKYLVDIFNHGLSGSES